MKNRMTTLAMLSAVVALSGCTTARMQAMMPRSAKPATQHPYSVCVGHAGEHVRDAHSLNPGATPYFGHDDATFVNEQTFMDTVVAVVTKAGVFQKVVSEGPADYRLDVNILSEIQPSPGLQMSSTLVTSWKLTHSSDGKVVCEERIEKTHKATPGSFVGIRTAVEGAVRDSIEEGIQKLSRPDLVK